MTRADVAALPEEVAPEEEAPDEIDAAAAVEMAKAAMAAAAIATARRAVRGTSFMMINPCGIGILTLLKTEIPGPRLGAN
jgi:hypothetical protein